MVVLYPGDIILLTAPYHDGWKIVLRENSVMLVIAVFIEHEQVVKSGISRARDRIWVMPAGEMRYYDLQYWWFKTNCKRLTAWTTKL